VQVPVNDEIGKLPEQAIGLDLAPYRMGWSLSRVKSHRVHITQAAIRRDCNGRRVRAFSVVRYRGSTADAKSLDYRSHWIDSF